MIHRYSPHPIGSYRLPLQTDEVSIIVSQVGPADAVWNLFWLSTPGIDTVIGAGEDWWKKYRPNPNGLKSVIDDVCTYEHLQRRLLMNPNAFIEWFERVEHPMFECYETYDGEDWVDIVLTRANEASGRLLSASPFMVARNGRLEFTSGTL